MELNYKQLKAAVYTASKKDIRYYLNSVFVEVRSGFYRIVSTDGSNMSVFHNFDLNCAETLDLIIPREVIENLPKQSAEKIVLEKIGDDWRLGSLVFKPMEAKYPDYRRVLPKQPSGETAQLLHEALSLFGKIADMTVKKGAHVRVWHNGDNASAVTIAGCDEFLGVIMPSRKEFLTKLNMENYPSWLAF